MQANRFQTWFIIRILALPYFAGLRVSVSLCLYQYDGFRMVGGGFDLGSAVSRRSYFSDTMFAIIVLISAISLLGMFLVDPVKKHSKMEKGLTNFVNVKSKLTKNVRGIANEKSMVYFSHNIGILFS